MNRLIAITILVTALSVNSNAEMSAIEKATVLPSCIIGVSLTVGSAIGDTIPIVSAFSGLANILLLPNEIRDEIRDELLGKRRSPELAALITMLGPFTLILTVVADGVAMSIDVLMDGRIDDRNDDYEVLFQLTRLVLGENYPFHLPSRKAAKAFFHSDETSCGKFFQAVRDMELHKAGPIPIDWTQIY